MDRPGETVRGIMKAWSAPGRPLIVNRYASMNVSPTWMFEVCYKPPIDPGREEKLTAVVIAAGGRLDYREAPEIDGSASVCLTFEFDDFAAATAAGEQIRMLGEHVEGSCQYS